jgi:hypothetical protein
MCCDSNGGNGTKLRMYDVRRDSSGWSNLANTSGTGCDHAHPARPAPATAQHTVQDLSWSEDAKAKAKAVAVEFRNDLGQRAAVCDLPPRTRLVIEKAASQGPARFSNLLGFYPWPDTATTDYVTMRTSYPQSRSPERCYSMSTRWKLSGMSPPKSWLMSPSSPALP